MEAALLRQSDDPIRGQLGSQENMAETEPARDSGGRAPIPTKPPVYNGMIAPRDSLDDATPLKRDEFRPGGSRLLAEEAEDAFQSPYNKAAAAVAFQF